MLTQISNWYCCACNTYGIDSSFHLVPVLIFTKLQVLFRFHLNHLFTSLSQPEEATGRHKQILRPIISSQSFLKDRKRALFSNTLNQNSRLWNLGLILFGLHHFEHENIHRSCWDRRNRAFRCYQGQARRTARCTCVWLRSWRQIRVYTKIKRENDWEHKKST